MTARIYCRTHRKPASECTCFRCNPPEPTPCPSPTA